MLTEVAMKRGLRRAGLTLLAVIGMFVCGCEPNSQGYEPTQPIAYSHAVHAGAYKIPCQYCHYAAERGRYAGIPPASLCMNCHKQVAKKDPEFKKVKQALDEGRPIAWVRVHNLPDHTYFNHKVHVQAKVKCQTCHGPVETMGRVRHWAPLTMGWCLDCHRDQGANPGSQPEPPRVQANRLTDCANCHH